MFGLIHQGTVCYEKVHLLWSWKGTNLVIVKRYKSCVCEKVQIFVIVERYKSCDTSFTIIQLWNFRFFFQCRFRISRCVRVPAGSWLQVEEPQREQMSTVYGRFLVSRREHTEVQLSGCLTPWGRNKTRRGIEKSNCIYFYFSWELT